MLLLSPLLAAVILACAQDGQSPMPDIGSNTTVSPEAEQSVGETPTAAHNPTPQAAEGGPSSAVEKMLLVPAGQFTMGATPEQQDEVLDFGWSDHWMQHMGPLVKSAGPSHQVYLDAFYIDKHEVSNKQYANFVDATGHRLPASWGVGRCNQPNLPVVSVSWGDANAYCLWAGKRLPTEAEWEKAARGPTGAVYPWGNSWDSAKLRSAEEFARRPLQNFNAWLGWERSVDELPAEVGSYPEGKSPFGLMDMAGNVWEWVADWFDPDYYTASPARNPRGPATGNLRVLRGGGWDVPKVVAFSWIRETFIPPEYARSFVTGFRCASTNPPKDQTVPAHYTRRVGSEPSV